MRGRSASSISTDARAKSRTTCCCRCSRRITSQIARFIEHRNAERRIVERQAEVDLARRIQLGFFPKIQPNLEGFSIAGASRPAQEIGGDYFDFIPFPNGHLMIPLGDVSGHGLGAAMIMAETRAYLRALGLSGMHLGTILSFANSRLIEDTNGDHFVTLFLPLLNPYSRSLIYSNAGQGPGYIFDREGDLRTTLDSTDIPLGVEPDWVFHNDRATMLESGDLVLLMTDGILEARSADRRLLRCRASDRGGSAASSRRAERDHRTPDPRGVACSAETSRPMT